MKKKRMYLALSMGSQICLEAEGVDSRDEGFNDIQRHAR